MFDGSELAAFIDAVDLGHGERLRRQDAQRAHRLEQRRDLAPRPGPGGDAGRRGLRSVDRRRKDAWCRRSRPSEIVDPTGCGDAWRGALLYGLEQGWPLARCARAGQPGRRDQDRQPRAAELHAGRRCIQSADRPRAQVRAADRQLSRARASRRRRPRWSGPPRSRRRATPGRSPRPAMSSSVPMRPAGMRARLRRHGRAPSLFISEANAPGAMPLTTMLSFTSRSDMRLVRWIRPALLAAYE